jgi:hypothetical protein
VVLATSLLPLPFSVLISDVIFVSTAVALDAIVEVADALLDVLPRLRGASGRLNSTARMRKL